MKAKRNRTNPNRKLDPKQERAAVLLAEGMRFGLVAETVDVGRTTLWEWRRLPAFEARFNVELADARDALRTKIRHLQTRALEVVEETLDRKGERLRDRLAAARIVLKLCPPPEPREAGPTTPEEVEEDRARTAKLMAGFGL